MRTIKFRGRDEDGNWLYGDLRQRMGYYPAIIESYCTDEGKVGYREVAVEENTVGQFTGLKDKDGQEIYEGDVLSDSAGKGILHFVEYDDEEGAFVGLMPELGKDERGRTHSTGLRQWWVNKNFKHVVGNIHDNPELLNRK